MVQQLTIYDALPKQKEFKFGDPVRVIEIDDSMDAETHHYLSMYQGKRGLIAKVIRQPSLQYEVDFNGRIASVYHGELEGVK